MKCIKYFSVIILMIVSIIIIQSCEKDYYYEAPPPHVAVATSTLEASFVNTPPSTLNSPYWSKADYLKVNAGNMSIQQLYGDGLLNMTGTYNGLTSFSKGANPSLTLKAAYDNNKLYLLAEWTDSTVNPSFSSWLWNGPIIDPLKSDPTDGWTSQRNNDQFALAFEIQTASSQAGSFSSVGCRASCHGSGASAAMHPDIGKVDIWNWSLARSAPLGYALDMIADQNTLLNDAGNKMYVRNVNGTTDRSGPAYEWDGLSQSVTLGNGLASTLNPAFYLYNNNKTAFTGDIQRGDSIYHRTSAPGHCVDCHGEHGEGGSEQAINSIELNKDTRQELITNMDNIGDMAAYWGPLSASDKNDIVAYLRGLSGVPGYYLTPPDGSNADIVAVSNVSAVQINNAMLSGSNKHGKYQLLIIRNLKTNNADDVQIDLSVNRSYKFGVAIMDNDGKNHIGSALETLTFK